MKAYRGSRRVAPRYFTPGKGGADVLEKRKNFAFTGFRTRIFLLIDPVVTPTMLSVLLPTSSVFKEVSCTIGIVISSPHILIIVAFIISASAYELRGCGSIPG